MLSTHTHTHIYIRLTMRVVSNTDQENASNYAMKGFAIGVAQWASVGLFASGLLYAFMPWYRKTQTVNKVNSYHYLSLCTHFDKRL